MKGKVTVYRNGVRLAEFAGDCDEISEEAERFIARHYCEAHGQPVPDDLTHFISPYFDGYQAVGKTLYKEGSQ